MTLRDADYYAGRDLTYPARPHKPSLASRSTPAGIRAYADVLVRDVCAARDAWSIAMRGRSDELAADLAAEYGLTEKQTAVLFSKAWEDGHSAGIQEVIDNFDELVGIVLRFNEAD